MGLVPAPPSVPFVANIPGPGVWLRLGRSGREMPGLAKLFSKSPKYLVFSFIGVPPD
jgi:hypothetical protein